MEHMLDLTTRLMIREDPKANAAGIRLAYDSNRVELLGDMKANLEGLAGLRMSPLGGLLPDEIRLPSIGHALDELDQLLEAAEKDLKGSHREAHRLLGDEIPEEDAAE